MSESRYRAHDLLRLRRCPRGASEEAVPAWVPDAFAHSPFAVVRRARAVAGIVPVGLRGATRAQRYAAYVDEHDVEALLTPEHLVHARPLSERAALPPFMLLRALSDSPCLAAYEWGPTGSTAFELATGVPTITASSDLDLLIRVPGLLPREEAQRLLSELENCAVPMGTRIDVQLETPAGGVALAEWAARKSRTMVRTANGPRLVADPWSIELADLGENA